MGLNRPLPLSGQPCRRNPHPTDFQSMALETFGPSPLPSPCMPSPQGILPLDAQTCPHTTCFCAKHASVPCSFLCQAACACCASNKFTERANLQRLVHFSHQRAIFTPLIEVKSSISNLLRFTASRKISHCMKQQLNPRTVMWAMSEDVLTQMVSAPGINLICTLQTGQGFWWDSAHGRHGAAEQRSE